MKIMFASDIHGSAYYCRKMLDIYSESGAGRLVILGAQGICPQGGDRDAESS